MSGSTVPTTEVRDRTLSVLHVVPTNPDGEIPCYARGQISSLEGVGVAGTVFRFSGSQLRLKPASLAEAVSRLKRTIRESSVDIVHAHWGSLLGYVTSLAAPSETALVITYRGSDVNPSPEDRRVGNWLRGRLSRAASRRADAVVCVSEQLGRQLGRQDAVIIADGTDTAIFHPGSRSAARESLGWQSDDVVLTLNQGDRPVSKGRDLAEATVRELRTQGLACHLNVLDGTLNRDQVAKQLVASDCVLMLSRFEGSPNIVREAIACGTPVVSVDVGDAKKWVDASPRSVMVPRSAGEISKSIQSLLRTPDVPTTPARVYDEAAARDALLAVYRDAVGMDSQAQP